MSRFLKVVAKIMAVICVLLAVLVLTLLLGLAIPVLGITASTALPVVGGTVGSWLFWTSAALVITAVIGLACDEETFLGTVHKLAEGVGTTVRKVLSQAVSATSPVWLPLLVVGAGFLLLTRGGDN